MHGEYETGLKAAEEIIKCVTTEPKPELEPEPEPEPEPKPEPVTKQRETEPKLDQASQPNPQPETAPVPPVTNGPQVNQSQRTVPKSSTPGSSSATTVSPPNVNTEAVSQVPVISTNVPLAYSCPGKSLKFTHICTFKGTWILTHSHNKDIF